MNCCERNRASCNQGRQCPERCVPSPEEMQSRAAWVGIVLVVLLVAACALGIRYGIPLQLPTN